MYCDLLANQGVEGCLQVFARHLAVVWQIVEVNDVVGPVSRVNNDVDSVQLLIEPRRLVESSEEALDQVLIDSHMSWVELGVQRVIELAVRVELVGIFRRDLRMGERFPNVGLGEVSAAVDFVDLLVVWHVGLDEDISCVPRV